MVFVDDDLRGATGMLWSVKGSFLDYVAAQPDGDMTQPQATFLGRPAFYFAVAPRNGRSDEPGPGSVCFSGCARFKAHDGALAATVSNPSISVGEGGASLFIDAPGTATGRMALARLSETATGTVDGVPATIWNSVVLTMEGTDLFGGYYNPRTRLAPLAVLQDDQLKPAA